MGAVSSNIRLGCHTSLLSGRRTSIWLIIRCILIFKVSEHLGMINDSLNIFFIDDMLNSSFMRREFPEKVTYYYTTLQLQVDRVDQSKLKKSTT